MWQNHTSATVKFNELFAELLRTAAEEHTTRTTSGDDVERLIDIRERLHSLRSELAAVRAELEVEDITSGLEREREGRSDVRLPRHTHSLRIRKAF